MFQWLKTLLERRRLGQRALFRYSDGTRLRYADPAMIWRALYNHPGFDLATMGQAADEGQEPEATQVYKGLCDVFGVKPFDSATGEGLATWEVFDLLRDFEAYLETLKKKYNPSRMPLQLWALGLSPPSPAEGTSTTPRPSA